MRKVFEGVQVALVTVALFFAVDWLFGAHLLKLAGRETDEAAASANLRIPHAVYHHDLSPNFRGVERWGGKYYKVCTNASGFNTGCNQATDQGRAFDLAFIGDSFTEGVGLPFEDSFVGKIAGALPDLKVANLAAVSYAPSIYLTKIRYLLDHGFSFKEVVVYIDISDIQDEAIYYDVVDGKVTCSNKCSRYFRFRSDTVSLAQRLLRPFPVAREGFAAASVFVSGIGNRAAAKQIETRNRERAGWTTDPKMSGYGPGGVQRGIEKSLQAMTELHALLAARGIALSVGVYPWPNQLLTDVEESQQVKLWKEFCAGQCRRFYNNFPEFFALARRDGASAVIKQLFIPGDAHFNPAGSQLIADNFLKNYR